MREVFNVKHNYIAGLWLALMFPFNVAAQALTVGVPAPAFELYDQHGRLHKLSDYAGRWVVVYFYPKDDTPGCTREACEFRDDFQVMKSMRVALLGISLDDVESHRKFADKYGLPFPLLSDPAGEVAAVYGTLWKLGPIRFARRHSFIIDPQGRIARIYRKVEPANHSDEVISALRAAGADAVNRDDEVGSE